MIKIRDYTFEVFLSQEEIQARVKELGASLATEHKDHFPLFLGVLKGVFVFMADLVRACPIPMEVTFAKVSSYKGMESTGQVKYSFPPDISLAGRHVVLVEDIVDTGTTLHHLIPFLQNEQLASLTVVTFLFKPDALKYPLQLDHVGFEIPNDFVIGYGLDYDERGRELPELYRLKQAEQPKG